MSNLQMAGRGAWLALFLMFATVAPAPAQTTLGRVAERCSTTSGGVLPGATITLTNTETTQVQTTVSERDGRVPVSAGAGRHLQGRTSRSQGFKSG